MPCSLHTEVFSDEVERSLPFCVGTIKELHVSLSLQKPPPGEEQDSVGLAEFFAACRAVEDLKVHCYESPGSFWLLAVPGYVWLHLVDWRKALANLKKCSLQGIHVNLLAFLQASPELRQLELY